VPSFDKFRLANLATKRYLLGVVVAP